MSDTADIPLTAFVDASQHHVILAAAEQLSMCLGDAHVLLCFADGRPDPVGPPALAIVSLLEDVTTERPMPQVEADWRHRLRALRDAGHDSIVLLNVFGFVADASRRVHLMERIRRLNLLATTLSREFGVYVADMDRIFTVFGAAECRTDFRLGGRIAAEIAGHAIVATLLALGLDAFAPPALQEQAAARHGGLERIASLVAQRAGAAL